MEARTCDSVVAPLEHADPADTQIPAWSRAVTSTSPETPGMAKLAMW